MGLKVETPRLTLREMEPSDAAALFQIESKPDMVRFQEFEARTLESSVDYVSRAIMASTQTPRAWTELAVCLEGELIGRVGASVEDRLAWMWYVIDRPHQGKGYAREAVTALMTLIPEVRSFNIECDPRNVPSWKLAESLGFQLDKEVAACLMIKGELCGSRTYSLIVQP